jgi:hypothetical protein
MYRANSHRKFKHKLKKDLGADPDSQNQKKKTSKTHFHKPVTSTVMFLVQKILIFGLTKNA